MPYVYCVSSRVMCVFPVFTSGGWHFLFRKIHLNLAPSNLAALEEIHHLRKGQEEACDVTDSALKLVDFLGVSPAVQVSPSNDHASEAAPDGPHTSVISCARTRAYVHFGDNSLRSADPSLCA